MTIQDGVCDQTPKGDCGSNGNAIVISRVCEAEGTLDSQLVLHVTVL